MPRAITEQPLKSELVSQDRYDGTAGMCYLDAVFPAWINMRNNGAIRLIKLNKSLLRFGCGYLKILKTPECLECGGSVGHHARNQQGRADLIQPTCIIR